MNESTSALPAKPSRPRKPKAPKPVTAPDKLEALSLLKRDDFFYFLYDLLYVSFLLPYMCIFIFFIILHYTTKLIFLQIKKR